MAKTPIVSFEDVLRVLGTLGYVVARQKGSHLRLRATGRPPVTVPSHNPVAPGTLRSVLKTIGLSVEQFVELLKR